MINNLAILALSLVSVYFGFRLFQIIRDWIKKQIALNKKYNFKIRKVIDLTENNLYPECSKCHKELSPYAVSKQEFTAQSAVFKSFKEKRLIIDENLTEYIILLCNNCCKITDNIKK